MDERMKYKTSLILQDYTRLSMMGFLSVILFCLMSLLGGLLLLCTQLLLGDKRVVLLIFGSCGVVVGFIGYLYMAFAALVNWDESRNQLKALGKELEKIGMLSDD